jgi:hypothetical protein
LCCWWRGCMERGGMRPSRKKVAAAARSIAVAAAAICRGGEREGYGRGRGTIRCDIRGSISVAHQARCATKYAISVAHQHQCAIECLISVAHWTWCATEIAKPIIGAGRCGPHRISVAHELWVRRASCMVRYRKSLCGAREAGAPQK